MSELDNIVKQVNSLHLSTEDKDAFVKCYSAMTSKLVNSYNKGSFKDHNQISIAVFFSKISAVILKPLETWIQDNNDEVSSKELNMTLNNQIEKFNVFEKKVEVTLEENRELLERKEELLKRYNTLKEKKEELENLIEVEAFLYSNDISSISKDLKLKGLSIRSIVETYNEKIQNLNEFLEKEKEKISKIFIENLKKAQKNLETLQKSDAEIVSLLSPEPLEIEIKKNKLDYENLVREYNARVNKLNSISADLKEVQEKHSEVMEVYRIHNLENNRIYGDLESKEGVLSYVSSLQNEINDKLVEYDQEIKNVIDKREQLPIYKLTEYKEHT